MPAAPPLETDVLIFGGGIAGLWTLRRLLARGYSALLLEREALGAGQTIASQGIIHGGLKYTLGGASGDAARAIADMPARWRASLEGRAAPAGDSYRDPDLREARILSHHQHIFTGAGVAARIAGVAAAKVIRTGVARLKPHDRPAALAGAPASCDVYRVDEPVLDPRSLIAALAGAEPARNCLGLLPRLAKVSLAPDETGVTIRLERDTAAPTLIRAAAVILAAGEGNESLLARIDPSAAPGAPAPAPPMQRRPLHMVMLRAPGLPQLWAHCVGPSSRPLLTITSQTDAAAPDRTVWYIGGELAERGVERDEPAQLHAARDELARLVPWIDLTDAEFAAFRINRAEGVTPRATRPDEPTIAQAPATFPAAGQRLLAVWPTKLAFAPRVADLVLERLDRAGLAPSSAAAPESPAALLNLQPPPIAPLPWEREDIRWS